MTSCPDPPENAGLPEGAAPAPVVLPEGGPPAPVSDEPRSRRTGSDERVARPGRTPDRAGAPEGRGAARRRLVLLCGALVAGAGALEGSARLGWFTTGVDAVGRGTVPVTATGADLVPGLSGLALLALAAVAAAVALAGAARRVLGGLVAAAGAYAGVAVVRLLLAPPGPADLAALPDAPAGGTAGTDVALAPGPVPAALGAVLLVGAGIGLVATESRLPRFGARYAARPSGRAESAEVADPDRAAWEALDAGCDPTTDPDRRRRTDARPTRTDGEVPDGPD